MEIRAIQTEADYECALRRIEKLWGAPEGTPEGDALEGPIKLVETYESEHFPI